jgi:hypothetical protein
LHRCILADKFDTVKLSASAKLDGAVTAAAEAIYKVKSGDLKLNAGRGVGCRFSPPRYFCCSRNTFN